MKKYTQCAIGAGLAFAATCAFAGNYTSAERGYVIDHDGGVYSYVINGTGDAASTNVTTEAQDVNADSRGSSPTAQAPVDESLVPVESGKSTVAVGSPDVNEVKGRA